MEDLATFFANPSVSALVGAFSAFLLVLLTDLRRRHRTKTLLTYIVQDNVDLAGAKRASVQNQIEMIRGNRFLASPIMRFNSVVLTQKHAEVMDLLDANQNQALSALIYQMESIDALLDDANQTARELKYLGEIQASNEQRTQVGKRLLDQYDDAERVIGHFIELGEYYVAGDYFKILEWQVEIKQGTERS